VSRRAPPALAAAAAVVLTASGVLGDVSLPPWFDAAELPPPAWARSVAPVADNQGRPGDLVLFSGAARTSPRRGLTAAGTTLRFYAARRGSGCTGPWWMVGPAAWTCSDDAGLSPADPLPAPRRVGTDGLESQYFFVAKDGTSAYASLESAEEGTPDRELESGWAVAVLEQRTKNGEAWGRTSKDLWIALRDLGAAHPSAFRGEPLADGKLDVAWVLADRANVWSAPSPKGKPRDARARFQVVHVKEENGSMVRTDDGAWMQSRDLSRPSAAPRPSEVTRPGERWIDVDLASQTLVAYEGDRPVYATLVSTGRADSPTPVGVHRIWVKILASDMGNLDNADADSHYSLQEVPYVQFFDQTVGLHGTYWHRDFGHVRSHGCVNLAPLDARWLFDFTSPRVLAGWVAVYPTPFEAGTLVRVR
jgi:hypothetical protein